jgi:predicted phage gp36 major capsid-like protein
MPSGTQARLPATLPTPAQARSALRLARAEVKEKSNIADGMKDRRDAAKDEVKAATAELEEAEVDLLEAESGSKEEGAAILAAVRVARRESP